MAFGSNRLMLGQRRMIYTCPMHPQIERDIPGLCPICGMTLEPKGIPAGDGEDRELVDMSRRFWIALVLAVPVFVLSIGEVPLSKIVAPRLSQWIQLVISAPVVWWAGFPFFADCGTPPLTSWSRSRTMTRIHSGIADIPPRKSFCMACP